MTPRQRIVRAAYVFKPAERMLSVASVARKLDVHPETIRRWCRAGKISFVRYPNRYLKIPADVIEKILATGINNPPHHT